jgi:hypothetical protein
LPTNGTSPDTRGGLPSPAPEPFVPKPPQTPPLSDIAPEVEPEITPLPDRNAEPGALIPDPLETPPLSNTAPKVVPENVPPPNDTPENVPPPNVAPEPVVPELNETASFSPTAQSGFQDIVSERFPFGENGLAAEKGYPGIGRTAEGGPDFAGTDYLYPAAEGQLNSVTIKLTGSYTGDFDMANTQAGFTDGTPKGYTWHHVDDFDPTTGLATVQLVQRDAHMATYPHIGGVAQYEGYYNVEYGR